MTRVSDVEEASARVYSAAKPEHELKKEDINCFKKFLEEKELVAELQKNFNKIEINNALKAFKKALYNEKLDDKEVDLLVTALKHLKENKEKYEEKYSRVTIISQHKQLEQHFEE